MTRGSAVESLHLGVAVVVEPGGREVAPAGDPAWRVVVRSSVKPFQVLPFVLAGGVEAWGLEEADLALACSSVLALMWLLIWLANKYEKKHRKAQT